jgi:peptidoglycan/LPS O-acetylase OafA/YrhL
MVELALSAGAVRPRHGVSKGVKTLTKLNSFDWLRLLAAAMVIHHHVYPLSGRAAPSFFSTDYGALGVGIFFVISGYLVSGSLARSASIGDYLKKRLLRIEPGLIVALAVTALALGATVTTLPLGEYLRSPQVWLYVVKNALLYPVDYVLPGVFVANPFPAAVNGSLWTLRLEFSCYLALAALAAVKLLRPRVVTVLALAAAVALVALRLVWPPEAGWLRLTDVAVLNGYLFLGGVWLCLHGKAPPWWAVAVSIALLATPLWALGLPAVVLGLGRLPAPKLPADLSYGLYIYAFPLQQVLAANGMLSLWTSMAATLPFAAASWFLIEKPALRLKPKSVRPGAGSLSAVRSPRRMPGSR